MMTPLLAAGGIHTQARFGPPAVAIAPPAIASSGTPPAPSLGAPYASVSSTVSAHARRTALLKPARQRLRKAQRSAGDYTQTDRGMHACCRG